MTIVTYFLCGSVLVVPLLLPVMISECVPPPTYSAGCPDSDATPATGEATDRDGLQLLIVPTVDAINFQKGYLGADGERAAIEGELQIKGADLERWAKVSVLSC